MIARKMQVRMQDDGTMEVACGNLNGSISRSISFATWVWNIHEGNRQQATAFGSCQNQHEAIGEFLCKMFELTT